MRLKTPVLLSIIVIGALVWAPRTAEAATITVSTTDDDVTANDNCTLREAIQAANTDLPVDACAAGSGSDTIVVPAGTYTLTVVDNTVDGANGLPSIITDITISGSGAASTIIERSAAAPDFRIFGVGSGTLTLNDVTVRGGRGLYGSGVYLRGDLNVNNSVFRDNHAVTQVGGAISTNFVVDVTIRNSTFTDNSAVNYGAVGSLLGTLLVQNSVFSNNTSTTGSVGALSFGFSGSSATIEDTVFTNNSAASGSGAINLGAGASMTLTRVTVSGNTAGAEGGGISNSGTMTIINSTISGNNAPGGNGNGGGIYGAKGALTIVGSTVSGNTSVRGGGIYRQSGTLVVTNSTVSGNSSTQEGGGIGGGGSITLSNATVTENTGSPGAGIYIGSTGLTLKNTILAGNIGNDCQGSALTSDGYNFLGNNSGCTFTATTGDQVGTSGSPKDALLSLLQDSGGLTKTHQLYSAWQPCNRRRQSGHSWQRRRGL